MTFPETWGPDLTHNGDWDTFVAKVNHAVSALFYAGYIGGSGMDAGRGIAVDASGNAYVTGYTDSSAASFPETVGPDLIFNGGTDAFVAKVNPAGTALVYAGYIGGVWYDIGLGIAVDAGGNAYVTGETASNEASFPKTVGPDLTHNGGGNDAFVVKVNPTGSALLYAGYIGRYSHDSGHGIAVDAGGNAYVTGQTGQTGDPPFPPPPAGLHCSQRPTPLTAALMPSSPRWIPPAPRCSTSAILAAAAMTSATASPWTRAATPM